jgi:hypothetical protein
MTSNRKLIGIGAMALSLALAVATPAFAVGLRGGGAMQVGSGGLRGDQAIVGAVVPSANASYCARRWAYYDPASGKYMGDVNDGTVMRSMDVDALLAAEHIATVYL